MVSMRAKLSLVVLAAIAAGIGATWLAVTPAPVGRPSRGRT